MRVAIISRGESALRSWPVCYHNGYDERLAVNTAIDIFSADWLIASDPCALGFMRGAPSTGVATRLDLLHPGAVAPTLPNGLRLVDQSVGSRNGVPSGVSFSIEAALYFAVDYLDADVVDIFGADRGWPGDEQTASREPGLCGTARRERLSYHQDRWKHEARCLGRTLEALRDRCDINRITE